MPLAIIPLAPLAGYLKLFVSNPLVRENGFTQLRNSSANVIGFGAARMTIHVVGRLKLHHYMRVQRVSLEQLREEISISIYREIERERRSY